MKNGKKLILTVLMLGCIVLLSGCSVQQRLQEVGQSYKNSNLDTPQTAETGVDWSFVPELRAQAQELFLKAAPDAEITETAIAMKNGKTDKVIAVVHYTRGGTNGTYGFEFLKENGKYALKRYGDGIDDDDL